MSKLPDDSDDEFPLHERPSIRSKPRPHHYQFAHVLLPLRLWQNPGWFLDILQGEYAHAFLLTCWAQVAMHLNEADILSPDGKLRCDLFGLAKGYRAAVISLPEPERMAEAHMVAVVWRPPRRRLLFLRTEPVLRYFTLELSVADDFTTPKNVFCEWSQSLHLNYGNGPEATVTAFVAFIERFLKTD